jgi:hypothetical protein
MSSTFNYKNFLVQINCSTFSFDITMEDKETKEIYSSSIDYDVVGIFRRNVLLSFANYFSDNNKTYQVEQVFKDCSYLSLTFKTISVEDILVKKLLITLERII